MNIIKSQYLFLMKKFSVTVSDDLKYVFFRNPKTATRSVLFSLDESTSVSDGVFNFTHKKNKHKTGYDREYNLAWDCYFKFGFVRNPWDRLVSTYNNKIKNYNQWTPKFYIKYKNYEFKDFCKALKKFNVDESEEHIRSQHKFFPTNIDFIGRFETLCSDFNFICEKLSISLELPHRNKTCNKLNYAEYYDDETCSIIAEKYAKDIKYFNYEFGK